MESSSGFEMACIWHKSKTVKTDCHFVSRFAQRTNAHPVQKRGIITENYNFWLVEIQLAKNVHEIFVHINHFNVELWQKVLVLLLANINARHRIIEQIKHN